MATEKVFRNAYLSELRAEIKAGNSLSGYYEPAPEYADDCTFPLQAELIGERPTLVPSVDADVDNACLLHTYLQNLTAAQASDKRLWVYLTHSSFREYVQERWPLPYALEECDNKDKAKSVANSVLLHWFVEGTDSRSLKRHALARLWWAAHLTVAPWERNPAFEKLAVDDRYKYTRILLSSETLFTEVTERVLGSSDVILVPLLEFIDKNPEYAPRTRLRPLMKELNLASGIKRLPLLTYEDIYALIEGIAKDITEEESVADTTPVASAA